MIAIAENNDIQFLRSVEKGLREAADSVAKCISIYEKGDDAAEEERENAIKDMMWAMMKMQMLKLD